jgi:RNA polymerase sigma-70 factor (ECF subfamily)
MAASVDDAFQDVFVVVHRRLREFDGRHSLRSWLYAIARRVASHYRRARRRAFACEQIEQDLPDRTPGPLELAQQRETLNEVEAALAELGPEKRRLLVLADIEQHSVPEIAEMTGTGLSTIYTRLRRARQTLQGSASWQQLLIQHLPEQRQVSVCGS